MTLVSIFISSSLPEFLVALSAWAFLTNRAHKLINNLIKKAESERIWMWHDMATGTMMERANGQTNNVSWLMGNEKHKKAIANEKKLN